MYYIQKVRWAQEFQLIPGLGNLFDHYGLDSGHYLQLALLDRIPFVSKPFWNFSGYLLALGFLYFFVMPIFNMLNEKRELPSSDIMKLLFTPIVIHNCFYMHPGIGTDLPVFIFGSFLAVEMFKIFFENEKNLNIILICFFLGFSSKISFFPTAVLSIAALSMVHFRSISNIFRKYKLTIVLVTFAFLHQIHRNIVLTGYPLYPFDGISIPVKWKMDKNEVSNLSNGISNWAKGLRDETDPQEIDKVKKAWMKSRFMIEHRRIETLYPLILGIIGLIFINFIKRPGWAKISIFMLPALGQMAMWYFYAPDGRFASFAFWWLGAGLICFVVKELFPRKLFILLPMVVLLFSFSLHTIDFLGSKKELFIMESSDYVPTIPETFIYTTKSGLEVLVPENGKKCDDCPLPCTQGPRPNIRLIGPGIIESGFYLE